MSGHLKDETGNVHGLWRVVCRKPREREHAGVMWNVVCTSCAREREYYGFTLRKKPPRCRCQRRGRAEAAQ